MLRRKGQKSAFDNGIVSLEVPPRPDWLILEIYGRDTRVRFKMGSETKVVGKMTEKRRQVSYFSPRAQRRLKLACRCVIDKADQFVSLTYPSEFPKDIRESKRHLDRFLKRLRRRDIKVLRVQEYQERGAVHYHLITLGALLDKTEVSRMWYECVGSEDEYHLQAGTNVELIIEDDDSRGLWDSERVRAARKMGKRKNRLFITRSEVVNYMVSYLRKAEQKQIPEDVVNNGNFWSMSRGLIEKRIVRVKGKLRSLKRLIRPIRKAYKAKLRAWGIKWRGWNKGFLFWDGTAVITEMEERCYINLSALGWGESGCNAVNEPQATT